jgi:preprotein translocase subunit SecE
MKKLKIFFGEMTTELRRVVWPSPDKVAENTRIVAVSTIVLALFFGFVDFLLVSGVNIVF